MTAAENRRLTGTPRRVEALRPRVQQLVDEILDEAAERGELDVVHDLGFTVPVTVICELMGVPVADREQFGPWSSAATRLLDGIIPEDEAMAGVAGLVGVTGLVLLKADMPQGAEPTSAHAYKVSHALLLAGLIAGVSLVAAWLGQIYGDTGVLAAAILVGLAEIHAAAASIAQVSASGGMSVNVAAWGMTGALAASVLAKTVLALFSGGVNYGWRVAVGLLAMLAGMAGAMLLRN